MRPSLGLLAAAALLTPATGLSQVLPPPPSGSEKGASLPVDLGIQVREFHFEGNTVFTSSELAEVTKPFTNRKLSAGDLEEARRAVTVFYVERGFVNSGAVIPDQDPSGGVVLMRVVEGSLTGIELRGNRWLKDGYILSRIRRTASTPLNLDEVRDGLQKLRQNPNVERVTAELKPGAVPGEGILDVDVRDKQPFRVGVQVDNQRPPSVGAEEIWLLASDMNVTGHSDVLDVRYGVAQAGSDGPVWSGADNLEASYLLPISRYDTTIGLRGSRLNTSLVEETFMPLDVESVTTGYGVTLRQPFFQTSNQEAAVSIGFDHRRNETTLLGEDFNLSPGAVDGRMVVSVLRLTQEWTQRQQSYVLGLRSTFNLGLDVIDATDSNVPGEPNARYFSWLGQGQYVRRLFGTQNLLVLRVAGQWASESLLALEQISVGGMETVRGYRENTLVRDVGISSSVEFRIPVLFDRAGAGIVHLAPFFDAGGAWNVDDSPEPTTISSVGIGLLATPCRHVAAELYWGHPLRHIEVPDDDNAQDLGLHFRVNIAAF